MSSRKRPLEPSSDDLSDSANKRQKVTHNGTNNKNDAVMTLEVNNDIQKKIEENRLAALRRKEQREREKIAEVQSQSSQNRPSQIQQLQQHLRSPARSSQQSQSPSPNTSPNGTSPVKDYTPLSMKRPEKQWVSNTPPEEPQSPALKNSKITQYFVFEKDPPVKSPHFSNGKVAVPPKPAELGNVARKINFDSKSASTPTKIPAIALTKNNSNLSNGIYDANTQTDESQNMEEDNLFDLSVLVDPSQPPTQPLTNNNIDTQPIAKSTPVKSPTRAAPAAAPKKVSPAPKKAASNTSAPALPASTARKDAGALNKFYHNEEADTQTDESAMLTDSVGDQTRSIASLRGSNGLNNNTKSSAASHSMEEDDSVSQQLKLRTKQKLQTLSYKSADDEDADEESASLRKSSLLKEDDDQKGDWWRNPRDKTGKKPGEPGYDPSTLYIPQNEFNSLTDAKKQYWTIKKDRFDEIIFFQQGDFYNLFGPDAEIGCEQLGLLYNARLMSVGVNRRDYREWARKFAALGYKVTRVDQESTATTEEQKNQKQTKKKKTEERKVTELLTAGTMRDLDLFSDHNPSYLLIVKEGDDPLKPQFGICFVDTSTNEFGLCYFEDDERCSHFETILLQLKPKEILHDKGALSPRVKKLISLIVGKVTMTARVFPSSQQAEDLINYGGYFPQNISGDNTENWPEALRQVKNDYLLMQSIGAAVSYFEELNFAKEIVPVANYFHYDPNNQTKYLILDYVSLSNLEILQNNDTGHVEGSLLHTLNHCVTAFGKRTLRKWLCHPLRDVNILNDRYDCVAYFMEQPDFRENLRVKLKSLNDVERFMTRVQACTVDLNTFLAFIDNMQIIKDIIAEAQEIMNEQQTNAALLNTLIMNFPDLDPFFDLYSFDRLVAKNQGKITPKPNTMPDYDEAVAKVSRITTELDNFLKTQKKNLGIASLEYHFSKSENYTIKVKPQYLANKKLPANWERIAKLKAEERYQVPEVVNLYAQLCLAKEELDAICTRLLLEYVQQFEQVQNICKQAIEHLSQIDILMSFAVYSWQSESAMCRPTFVLDSSTKGSYVEFKNMRHPYLKPSSGIFVPNDVKLGNDSPRVLLITGPNMGGKSTILRQVAILTVMAQIGCFVPAENAVLTPVDRIFTRIGARDNIMGGLSTFMVELEETAKMLKYATGRSLVILDELGRGTSTFDGYSIAYAVLKHLETLDCRVLFSTHYHKLTDEFTDGVSNTGHNVNRHILSKSIASSHMACKEEDGHMIFLYKLQPGACPKSYGMHVAAMANIQQSIIQRADEMSAKFEDIVAQRRKKQHQKKEESFAKLIQMTPNAASNHQLILSLWRDCKKIVV